jgi:GT2 family glycosyltransferase
MARASLEPSASDTRPVQETSGPLHEDLDLRLESRRPARLPEATLRAARAARVPRMHCREGAAVDRPVASIVIVTHNGLPFTKLCLHSVAANTVATDYELIVVDNSSSDGTPEYLRELAQANANVRLVLNSDNRGFAAANNQAMAVAAGEVFVALNNDTMVPPGWLSGLLSHLNNAHAALVGPVTNRTCNEAQIETDYCTYGEFQRFAAKRAGDFRRRTTELPMLAMFCTAIPKSIYQSIGPLDEQFGLGMFEDDDYAMRARQAGYRLLCAEDVFVHHFGEASFGSLTTGGAYASLLNANRDRFERKWNATWQPHSRRSTPEDKERLALFCAAVARAVPCGATVAVVSKGDPSLIEGLAAEGLSACHFPQNPDGSYPGHHPADSADAITRFEELRARGVQFLLFPTASCWWLQFYQGLSGHLKSRYQQVPLDVAACTLVDARAGGN